MNTNLNMQTMPIDRLKPAKYNPRKDLKPGDPAYEKIKRSLHDFGYVDPIVWNEVTGNIVGGHQRYKVLKAEGATEVDCVVVHIENPSDEKALNIALNKATGDWEPTALADLLQDLQSAGYDLGATGFDAAEVDDLFSKVHDKDVHDDDCEINPETVNVYVQPGDIWTLGRHRMMCGDSTSPEAVDALMDGIKANLVVTDPPYNVAYESADGKKIQNDSMADEQFFAFLLAAFQNMAAHMAEGGSAYIFHADTEGLNFRRAFKESGFHISGVCIWVKNSLVLGRSPYQWQHEPVLYGWLPNGKHKWFADRKQSTIWNFDKPKKSADHPTMKPIPLLAYPIKNSSAPNAVVMDLFGGSDDDSLLYRCTNLERYAEENCVMTVTPQVKDSFFLDTAYGFKYYTFLTEELPAVTRSLFASSARREDNFLIGMAMGGNAALMLAMKRPDLFRAVVDLSGGIGCSVDSEYFAREMREWTFIRRMTAAFGPAEDALGGPWDLGPIARENMENGVDVPELYLAVGENDFIRDVVRKDRDALQKLGYVLHYEEAPGLAHEWDFWDLYMRKALREWLPLRRSAQEAQE